MTKLTPELEEHYRDSGLLLEQIEPMFDGKHSFVMMCVLSQLIAQWLLMHPEEQHNSLVAALAATVEDDIGYILHKDALVQMPRGSIH